VPGYLPNFPGLADTVSSLRWFTGATDSQSTSMLEILAPCGSMPEPLAPREVTCVKGKGRFLITGKHLHPVISSTSSGWLIMSAPQDGVLELLFTCWEGSAFKRKLCIREPLWWVSQNWWAPASSCLISSLCRLILSAIWGDMQELLAVCWDESTYRWRLNIWVLLFIASVIILLFSYSIIILHSGNKIHHLHRPVQVEDINMMGCCPVPWRDC
jgi:hypothetical protein